LVQEDSRREDVMEALGGLDRVVRPKDWRLLRDDYPEQPWIAGTLGGLARMGLLARRTGDSLILARTAALPDSELSGVLWEDAQTLTLTREGVAAALADTVSPWLKLVSPELVADGAELTADLALPGDFLSLMWLQLVNAINSGRPLKVCAFKDALALRLARESSSGAGGIPHVDEKTRSIATRSARTPRVSRRHAPGRRRTRRWPG
jgi:hypothetical protein